MKETINVKMTNKRIIIRQFDILFYFVTKKQNTR